MIVVVVVGLCACVRSFCNSHDGLVVYVIAAVMIVGLCVYACGSGSSGTMVVVYIWFR